MARLAFFGTPAFSLPFFYSVKQFCDAQGHELVLVVTQADQPQGRGQRLMPSPVKQAALEQNIPVLQPTTLRKATEDGDEFYRAFSLLAIDLAIVVAYGKIITERLLALPRRGFLNAHASLLPRFRGAAPVQRALQAGDTITGVCLMDMIKGLDEGDVFAWRATPIIPSDTSATLFRRLAHLGAALLAEHLDALLVGSLVKQPQANHAVVYAHMLEKHEGAIDFQKSGAILSREARAFDPWPTSFGFIRGKRIKFFDSFFIHAPQAHPHVDVGHVVCANVFLGIKTFDGILYFQRIQIEGKNILPVKEALRGFVIDIGDKIERQ